MTIVLLPSFLALLGIVLGGVAIGVLAFALTGLVGFLFAGTTEVGSALIMLAPLAGIAAAVGGWIWLAGLA